MTSHAVIIQGGLGNQLFQIFSLMNYCIENGFNFVFPLEMQVWDRVRHPYWDTFLYKLKEHVRPNTYIDSFIEYIEPTFHHNVIPLLTSSHKLNGYFQTELYFKKHFETICNLIGIREKQHMIKTKYIRFENTISLHFRMGDYGNPLHHPIIPDTYYMNSLHFIMNITKKEKWNVYYACEKQDDETVLVRIKNINKYFKHLNFIKISNDMEDWEQLLLMSSCEHNIIANSTFSWWSAYLNTTNEKIVCYPSLWFGPAKNSLNLKDLHPSTWNKIHI
jgi:hypothetical protein